MAAGLAGVLIARTDWRAVHRHFGNRSLPCHSTAKLPGRGCIEFAADLHIVRRRLLRVRAALVAAGQSGHTEQSQATDEVETGDSKRHATSDFRGPLLRTTDPRPSGSPCTLAGAIEQEQNRLSTL